MTYLNLVNNVLRRLREAEVSAIDETAYSALIGDIVNDARQQVEDSWDWGALRTDIVVATVEDTAQYALTGTQNRATVVDARNTTSNSGLRHKSSRWGRIQDLSNNTAKGAPYWYASDGIDGSGDMQVKVYPTPDGVYSLSLHVVQREADLADEGDTVSIPTMPIIHLAYALSARERGEVQGTTAAEIFGVAKRLLSDAIAYDSAKNPTDVIFYEV